MSIVLWPDIKFFKRSEFDQSGAPGSGVNMDLGFVAKLDAMRGIYGKTMIVTSGYRSAEYDAAMCLRLGKPVIPNNAHVAGHAADISCVTSRERLALIAAAIQAGINRIGVDALHIHLDDAPHLPPNVFFLE